MCCLQLRLTPTLLNNHRRSAPTPSISHTKTLPSFVHPRWTFRALDIDSIDIFDNQFHGKVDGRFDMESDPQSPASYTEQSPLTEKRLELEDNFHKERKSARMERKSLEDGWNGVNGKKPPAVCGTRQRRPIRVKNRQVKKSSFPEAPPEVKELPRDPVQRRKVEEKIMGDLELQILLKGGNQSEYSESFFSSHLPLLTRMQEMILGSTIQRAKPILDKQHELKSLLQRPVSIAEVSTALEMDPTEIVELLRARERAKALLVNYNLRLVFYCAQSYRFSRARVHYDDLVMEGIGPKGLGKAADRFDPSLGLKFSTYAVVWIKRVMYLYYKEETTTWRVSTHAQRTLVKIIQTMKQLANKENKGRVSMEAVAEEMNVSVNFVVKYLKMRRRAVSIESSRMYNHRGEMTVGLEDQIPAKQEDSDLAELQTIEDSVNLVLSTLEPRERNILRMRYGLGINDGVSMTLDEIAKVYNITMERVRQIEEKAKRKLREPWRRLLLDPDNTQFTT